MIASRFSDLWLSQSQLRQRLENRHLNHPSQHGIEGNWANFRDDSSSNKAFLGGQNDPWLESSSREGRPRFYDRFYTKTPGNFHVESESSLLMSSPNSASDISSRSAIKGRRVTEEDVKRIERRLSLKKTIRKQIMRDLSHAPNLIDNKDNDQANNKDAEMRSRSSGNLLEMLKEGHDASDDSGIGNHTPPLILRKRNTEEKMGLATMDSALLETSVSIPRARWSRSDWETLEMAHEEIHNNDNKVNKSNNKGLSRLKSFLLNVKPNKSRT